LSNNYTNVRRLTTQLQRQVTEEKGTPTESEPATYALWWSFNHVSYVWN